MQNFVFNDGEYILPLEVNAGENLRSKSLKVYDEKYHPDLVIRTSLSNLRMDGNLLHIPLYILVNMKNYVNQAIHTRASRKIESSGIYDDRRDE